MVFAGFIVLFTDDQTLLMMLGWVLAWLSGVAFFALPLAVAIRRVFAQGDVWFPSALLRQMMDDRLRPGGLIPVRCPIRSTSTGVCSQPPDEFRFRSESGLHGWQSDGR